MRRQTVKFSDCWDLTTGLKTKKGNTLYVYGGKLWRSLWMWWHLVIISLDVIGKQVESCVFGTHIKVKCKNN